MAVTYPKSNREKADLYINALHEIRVRLRSIDAILASPVPELVQAESCHLQLRLVCECFAVACLAAQGDFDSHKAFRDDYSPVAIFKALEACYPDFFPTPSIMQKTNEGWHFDGVGHGHSIARAEIESIWQKSGDHLHRASAKKYLKRTNASDPLAINRAKERFWNLIMDHMIILGGQKSRFHVHMDRATDAMECKFLNLDPEAGTATVEPYNLAL
ncbi:hypothetical protein ACFB49_40280 [Sphingomonas sp. DBB INV C78]